MLHRAGTHDGDPVISALNETLAHISRGSDEAQVWLVMGLTVFDYQVSRGAAEVEPPRDAVDERALAAAASVSEVIGTGSLRLTRPVILGERHAANPRCGECYAEIMGAGPGEVIGVYSIDLSITDDYQKFTTSSRGALALAILAAIGVTVASAAWIKRAVADSISSMRLTMGRLAGGDLAASVPDMAQADEFGDMARAAETLRSQAVKARELELRFAEAQRSATMGEMASGLAHELAQPLASIDAYCAGALRRLQEEPLDKEALSGVRQKILTVNARANGIIRSISDQVGGRPPELVMKSVNAVVEDLLPLLETEARRHDVMLRLDLAEDLPATPVDEVGVGSVLLNLARNAFDAMACAERRRLKIETRTAKSGVEIAAIDTGPGCPAETKETMFQPFFTTKATGMGMGLAICRSIAEAHGGRIWCEPAEGGGAAVRFTLPFEEQEPQRGG
jgi:signal transduction histidine kinase